MATPRARVESEIESLPSLKFVSCCEAAGPDASGYYVEDGAPVPAGAGHTSERIPEPIVPSVGVCIHEASHAVHLHARGYRIARVAVGRRNFVERAAGEGDRMLDIEQIEAAMAGDIGARYAMFRSISRMDDEKIDFAIARVSTGKHGSCDACLAGVFTRHIARLSGAPHDAAVMRTIWRLAESNAIQILKSGQSYSAIRSLGDKLQNETEMTGEAVHHHIEPYSSFRSQPTTTE